MQNLSIVIICKNSAAVIGKTLQSFAGLTEDVVVYDNGGPSF
jgi:glycosyltransferase involved in cell wall biosynthesis